MNAISQCFKIGLIKIMKMSRIILALQTNHSPGFDRSRALNGISDYSISSPALKIALAAM